MVAWGNQYLVHSCMDTTTKSHQRPAALTSDPGNMPVPLSIDFPHIIMKTNCIICAGFTAQ